MNEFESTPLTIGLMIFLAVIISAIIGFVWTVATIRKNDRDEIAGEISAVKTHGENAVDRLEKKTDTNQEQLHARVNALMLQDSEMREKVGYMKGVQDMQKEILFKLLEK